MALSRWIDVLLGRTGRAAPPPPEPPPPPHAWDDALFDALREASDDAPFAVLADWLLQEGDPRGELVSTMLLGGEPADLLQRHAAHLYGPLNGLERREVPAGRDFWLPDERYRGPEWPAVVAGWRRGFIDRLWVRPADDDFGEGGVSAEALIAMLGHPSTWVLRELVFGGAMSPSLAGLPIAPTVQKLRIGDFLYPEECEMSWSRLGDWSHVRTTFPNAREIHVQGGLGAIDLPDGVESFTLESSTTRGEVVRTVARRLGAARHIVLWTGSREYGSTVELDDVLPLLDLSPEHLGLLDSELADELIEPLAGSTALRGLRSLDLSLGTLTDAGARTLLAHLDAFSHLERLDLDRNALEAQIELRAAFGDRVSLRDQRPPGRYGTYVSVGE
ncbi:MAG: hypothetical protein H6737_11510 [Alphaproteobacteria bacterium]|nr:hypothetical protein [Alphaproteobacteria bacterium]